LGGAPSCFGALGLCRVGLPPAALGRGKGVWSGAPWGLGGGDFGAVQLYTGSGGAKQDGGGAAGGEVSAAEIEQPVADRRVGHRAPSLEARYMAVVRACGDGALLSGRRLVTSSAQ
jgi:hypothetical protein